MERAARAGIWLLGNDFGRRSVGCSQLSLPPCGVVPLAELETDVAINTDQFEPERLVQCNARLIRKSDTGKCIVKALFGQAAQQFGVERLADALSARVFRNVDGGVDRPAICRPATMLAAVSITAHASVVFGNQVRVLGGDAHYAFAHLRFVRRGLFKRNKRLLDDRAVDCGDGRGIGRRGRPDPNHNCKKRCAAPLECVA